MLKLNVNNQCVLSTCNSFRENCNIKSAIVTFFLLEWLMFLLLSIYRDFLCVSAGSITIKFEVFSRALDSEPTMGEIIFQLREAITTGSLVVTSTTGQRLVVDTNSFAWSTSELQTEIGLFLHVYEINSGNVVIMCDKINYVNKSRFKLYRFHWYGDKC